MIEMKPIARRTMLASSLALLGVMGAARPVAADATEGFAPVSGSRLFYRVEVPWRRKSKMRPIPRSPRAVIPSFWMQCP
jgi:hypothetical protein